MATTDNQSTDPGAIAAVRAGFDGSGKADRTSALGRAPRRRLAILLTLLALGACGYGLMLISLHASRAPIEATFELPEGSGSQRLQINIETLSVEAARQSANLRLEFVPAPVLRGKRATSPDRDITILVDDNSTVRDLLYRADQPMDPATVAMDLNDGDVNQYPFDRYTATLRITSIEGQAAGLPNAVPVPAGIYLWAGIPGWVMAIGKDAQSRAGDVSLHFGLARSLSIRAFAIAMYGAMILISCAALLVSSLVFIGRRSFDFAMMNWLAATMFTLPAVRFALPGGPPLGVEADMLIFLWAVLAEAVSMVLVAATWLHPVRRS